MPKPATTTAQQCEWCDEFFEHGPSDWNGRSFCSDECAREAEEETRVCAEEDRREAIMSGELIDGVGFANPGGHSALRAETPDNPRDQDCPNCGAENALTRIDRQRGYQCDRCADIAEGRIME